MLARLQTGGRTLEVWTEQLRSWLAAELLQPLDRLAVSAQKVCITVELLSRKFCAKVPREIPCAHFW